MTDEDQLDVCDHDTARDSPNAAVERIRASLTRRAEAVQVEPDLDGLATRAGSRRSGLQRFPLVAVAVVIAALAVTSAVLRPTPDRTSHLISRSGNQHDRAGDPTTTTSGASPTSRSGPNRMSTTTTTTTATGPTSLLPPDGGTTPSTEPGESPGDGTGATPEPEPVDPPPCAQVEGVILASTSWEGDVVLVVEYGRNATLRHLTIWRDPADPDACPERMNDPSGQPFGFSRPTPGGTQFESHTIGCSPARVEAVDGYSDDGVTWRFGFEAYVLEGNTATLAEERGAEYVEPADHDTIQSLLQSNCGVLPSGD